MPRKKSAAAAAAAGADTGGAAAERPRPLLDDSDGDGDVADDAPTLKINDAFAKRFQHNKEREELHRLQEKLGPRAAARALARAGASRGDSDGSDGGGDDDDDDDDSSSSSDEAPPEVDDRFLETLLKIRRRDPSIYEPGARLNPDSSSSDEEEEAADAHADDADVAPNKKRKPVYLRDVQAAQLLERAQRGSGDEGSDDDSDGDADGGELGAPRGPTYAQEQAALRAEFMAVAADVAGGGGDDDVAAGGLRLKRRAPRGGSDGGGAGAGAAAGGGRSGELLSELFAAPAPAGDAAADAFLKDYLANKRWMDADDDSDADVAGGRDDADDVAGGADGAAPHASDDELERQEAFEAKYNFRFEEPGGATLAAQPRHTEGSIRKVKSARAEKRKAKAERVAAEHAQLREEVKRLKNLKRKEIQAKLAQIRAVAGAASLGLSVEALDEEFDPDKHEAAMGAAFGDDYYAEEDEEEGALEKPQFGDLDEELQELLTGEVAGAGGFAAAARRAASAGAGAGSGSDSGDDDDASAGAASDGDGDGAADGEGGGEGSRFSKRAMKKWRRALAAKMEEYYALDCEDFVAGLPCRFKYKTVTPNMYGLKPEEILTLSDKALNQVVSLKKLAPYREAEPKPRYGGKRERAEAALARAAAAERQGGKRKRREGGAAGGEGDDEGAAAAAAARARSFVAPTKKARREAAAPQAAPPGGATAAARNAAKHAKRKAKKAAERAGAAGADDGDDE